MRWFATRSAAPRAIMRRNRQNIRRRNPTLPLQTRARRSMILARMQRRHRPTRNRLRILRTVTIRRRHQQRRRPRLQFRRLAPRMIRRRRCLRRLADLRPEIPKRRNPIRVAVPRWTQTQARIEPTRPLLRRRQRARKKPLAVRSRLQRRDRGALLLRVDLPRQFPRVMPRNRRACRVRRTCPRNPRPGQSFRKCGLSRLSRNRPRAQALTASLTQLPLRIRTPL